MKKLLIGLFLFIIMISSVHAACDCTPEQNCEIDCGNQTALGNPTECMYECVDAVDNNDEDLVKISAMANPNAEINNKQIEEIEKRLKYRSQVSSGILNAIDQLTNKDFTNSGIENAKAVLEKRFARMTLRNREKIDKLTEITELIPIETENNDEPQGVIIKGKTKEKLFGLFLMNRDITYEIGFPGEVKELGFIKHFFKKLTPEQYNEACKTD